MRCYRAAAEAIESVAREQLQPITAKALDTGTKDAGPRRKRLSRSPTGASDRD
jgi:hypothetical protein